MGEGRSSPFVLETGFFVVRRRNMLRILERSLEQWLGGRSRGDGRAEALHCRSQGRGGRSEHEYSRGRVLGLYGKKPEIQLCNQADCGTGSWLKSDIYVPQRLIAALDFRSSGGALESIT